MIGQFSAWIVRGRGTAGKYVVVDLRPAQAEDAAEGAHQLVLHLHLLLGSGTGAAAIEDKQCVLDVSGRHDGIDALGDCVLAATAGIARSAAQQKISDRSVRVIDDGDLLRQIVAALRVGGKDKAGRTGIDVRSADMLVERSSVSQSQARCGNVPDVGRGGDDGVRGGMIDVGAEIAGIGEITRLIRVPDDGVRRTW